MRKTKDLFKRFLCMVLSLLMLNLGIPQYTVLAAEEYSLTTVAGTGAQGNAGDGGKAVSATFYNPFGIAADNAGNLYIADTYNNRVRKVTADGSIITVAGTGNGNYSGDGGSAINAELAQPTGVAVDSNGNLYIADSGNNRIRKVTTAGIISTIAGTGVAGYSGDGGNAIDAQLDGPFGVALDSQGALYISDRINNRVRKVTADGIISTVAGTGVDGYSGDGGSAVLAQLGRPNGITLDSQDNLYIADYDNERVRMVSKGGIISTVAGNGNNAYTGDDGPAVSAGLRGPAGVAVDDSGSLYIIELLNQVVRKVAVDGTISTVAGNFAPLYADFYYPFGIAIDKNGNLFVADSYHNQIKKIAAVTYSAALSQSGEHTFTELPEGYTPGDMESKTVRATKTGTGNLTNLKVVLSGSGAGSFELGTLTAAALNNITQTADFTVKAKEGLAPGTYTATVTVSADKMQDISFSVKQVITEAANAEVPLIISQPEDIIVQVGAVAVLEVDAAEAAKGTLSYQWYRNTVDSNTGGTLIDGANLPVYTAPTEQEGITWYYSIVTNTDSTVTGNKTASVTSRAAKAEVNALTNADAPRIIKQPQDITVRKGEEAVLETAAAVSGGSITYQWYRNTANGTDGGTSIDGAVQASYTAQTNTEGKVWYYCKITNTDHGVSGNKTVTVTTRVAAVTVRAEQEPAAYTLTVINGSGSGDYTENTNVSITANQAPAGKVFLGWTATGNVHFQNAASASTVFSMPAENVTVTAVYQNITTGTGTPTPSAGDKDKTEEKTIEVVEAPEGIPNKSLITVEELGNAFDKSVEVRLKVDSIAEQEVRNALETDTIGLNTETIKIFPLDISLYIKGTNTKVQPAQGTSVRITCPVPTELLSEKEKLLVVTVVDGKLKILPAELTTKDGVDCIQFNAVHFSPYAFVVDSDGKLAEGAHTVTDITVTEGTLTDIRPENLPAEAEVKYHISTPTHISIDSEGKLFAKKAGSAVYMTAVTYGGKTKVYAVKVKVKKAQGGTKAGFIRYYGDIFAYKEVNYRITAKASGTGTGEAAVANNQINAKLPGKVVIPETIVWKGKKYKVTSIDESAFYNQKTITSVTIPANIKVISPTAFTSCSLLKEFKVDRANRQYSAKGGMLLNKQGTALLAYPSASGTVVIDRKITEIGSYAFSVCKQLKAVVIPDTVRSIGGCAFAHSNTLEKVVFQSSQVPEMTFYSVFEKVKNTCIFQVPASSKELYVQAMQEAWLPKSIVIKGK